MNVIISILFYFSIFIFSTLLFFLLIRLQKKAPESIAKFVLFIGTALLAALFIGGKYAMDNLISPENLHTIKLVIGAGGVSFLAYVIFFVETKAPEGYKGRFWQKKDKSSKKEIKPEFEK